MGNRPLPAIAKCHLIEAMKRIKAIYPSAYEIEFAEGKETDPEWYTWFTFRNGEAEPESLTPRGRHWASIWSPYLMVRVTLNERGFS